MTAEQKSRAQLLSELAAHRSRIQEIEGELWPTRPEMHTTSQENINRVGEEVSCRILNVFIDAAQNQGVGIDQFLDGVDFDLDYVLNTPSYIPWDAYCRIMSNMHGLWDKDDYVRIGGYIALSPWVRPLAITARTFFTPQEYYRMLVDPEIGMAEVMVTCTRSILREMGPNHIELQVELIEGYRYEPYFFWMSLGGLTTLPQVFGLPDAEVEMIPIEGRGAIYDIKIPADDNRWLSGIRKIVRFPFKGLSRRREMEETREVLRTKYADLTRNATERLEMEAALIQSERRLQLIAEHIDEAIWLTDNHDTNLLYMSAGFEKITGYSAELVNVDITNWFTFIHPDDLPGILLQREMGGDSYIRANREMEYRIVRPDGDIRNVLVRSRPVFDDTGRMLHRIGVMLDITERKRSEEAVAQSQKLESLVILAGGVAHDFNNLLVAIGGQASVAMAKLEDGHNARRHVDKILTATERAADLTRQMLVYVGRGQHESKTFGLNELISENMHLFEVAVGPQITLKTELLPSLPYIKGDMGQMQQVVMNLIINAAEAMIDNGGEIKISTYRRDVTADDIDLWAITRDPLTGGDYSWVQVSDQGSGMDDETLARIFDPFYTTKFTGRGLGLAAVIGIVRAFQGGLKVESAKGEGTTFTLCFPAQIVPDDQPVPADAIEFSDDLHGTVLVVDDESQVRETIGDLLQSFGLDVHMLASGQEAVDLVGQGHGFDLVLLDVSMPGLSGIDTMQLLRNLGYDRPIILSSGFAEYDVAEHIMNDPNAVFLQKPYRLRALYEAVRLYMTARPISDPDSKAK